MRGDWYPMKLTCCALILLQIIPDVGLVITLYDISAIEGGEVYPSDGAPRFSVSGPPLSNNCRPF